MNTHSRSNRESHLAGRLVCLAVASAALVGCASTSAPPADSQPQAPSLADQYSVSLTLAEAAERSGDLLSAATYYGQAIAEGKGGAKPYFRRGMILLRVRQPEAAANVFEAALAAGYNNIELHQGYGRALALLGQPEAALKEYDLALARDLTNVQIMNGRGVVLDMLGRHEDAQTQYRYAIQRSPGNLSDSFQ